MSDRYAGYDVLDKRQTPSWNAKTRQVVDERMSYDERQNTLTPRQLETLRRVVARIAPQPEKRPPANTVAILLKKIIHDVSDGYRPAELPRVRECWLRGLDAIEAEARSRYAKAFAELAAADADRVLSAVEKGETRAAEWHNLRPRLFWSWRLLPDIVSAHWSHPSLWSHIGYGGPASPRGYVRLDANSRDSWEAKERPVG